MPHDYRRGRKHMPEFTMDEWEAITKGGAFCNETGHLDSLMFRHAMEEQACVQM